MREKSPSDHNDPAPVKTALWHKASLILFGLILCVLLLEAGLRLGGFILTSFQEYANRVSLSHKGSYRILCLGESTTAMRNGHSYPQALEKILNQRNLGTQFSVINKGVPGTDTASIVAATPGYLDEYKPDMVIAMMGINDRGGYIRYDDVVHLRPTSFPYTLKVVKLARLLWQHLMSKMSEAGLLKKQRPEVAALGAKPSGNVPAATGPRTSHNMPVKAVPVRTRKVSAQVQLGCDLRKEGDYAKAEQTFRKAIEEDPKDDTAYVELAWNYIFGQYAHDHAIVVDLFKKAIELDPRNYEAYLGLGRFYTYSAEDPLARGMFEKAIKIDPDREEAYLELGELFGRTQEYGKAVEMFTKVLRFDPQNYKIYSYLSFYYKASGKYDMAQEEAQKADRLLSTLFDAALAQNYSKLEKLLSERKIRLICVQYPMRSVALLKRIFQDHRTIVFVDNEKLFKDAVAKDGYNSYFDDIFAGDFGHCTEKGNRLLAENIARVLSKEVFGK